MRIVYAVSMTIGCSVFPPALRARIDGAVMRLPGTGEGVARLVEVSMVKVDMAAASSGFAAPRQKPPGYRSQPRWRECRANQKIVQVIARMTSANAMSFVLTLSRTPGTTA